ncbi:hypothetical protein N9C10_02885 [Flavobacteriaceae bacterium]|nr:hypothetical protein [Flavobacteriaceae bacterium]
MKYVTKVFVNNNVIRSDFMDSKKELHMFINGWRKNRTRWLGVANGGLTVDEFKIEVFDVSKPCASDHIDKPLVFLFL